MTLDLNPFFFKGGSVGCLLIHGGTGSPPEMRGMGEYLAGKGLTVLGVRLAGHGTTPEDLATKSWRDLIASAEEGLSRLQAQCYHVFVAGLSLGGLITLYLAAHHPIQGAIVMSAPAYIKDWRLRLLPVLKLFIKWFHSSGELDLTDPEAGQRVFFYRRIPTAFRAGPHLHLAGAGAPPQPGRTAAARGAPEPGAGRGASAHHAGRSRPHHPPGERPVHLRPRRLSR